LTKYLRKSRLFMTGVALAVLAALPRPARAAFDLTLSPLNFNLTWTAAVDPSTTAPSSYMILYKPGLFSNPLQGGTTIAANITLGTSLTFGGKMTAGCYVVRASNVLDPLFDNSVVKCHSFMHSSGGGNDIGILRGDGNGGQIGFNQLWNISYFIDSDAYMVMRIYSPTTVFVSDPVTGFLTPAGGSVPVKTVIDGVPRSNELVDGSFKNTDTWDSRNSSGTTVSNGLYNVFMSAYLQSGTTVFAFTFTLPVNIVRFTALTTSGITSAAPSGSINYSISANSSVRIVIAKPGRLFTLDANGDVQPLDASGTVIDTSTNSVVAILTPTVSAGPNTTVWNGLNSQGVAVSTGLYAVGVSGKDFSGNQALNLSGNNGPIQGSIAVDRIPAQSAPGGAAPNVTAISVGGTGVNLAGGSLVGTFSSIGITLSATGGPATTVTLTGPGGLVAGGSVQVNGTAVTYSTSAVLSSTGSYTVTISPFDLSGTVPGAVTVTQFSIPASGGGVIAPGLTQTNASFGATLAPGPNPAVTSTKIFFNLLLASTVTVDIYTLTGHRVLHQTNSFASGQQFFLWGLVNDAGGSIANGVYIARVTATNALGTVHASKKILVVK
jgi:flagellar hook assembly protein FlgD